MYYVVGRDACPWCDQAKTLLDEPGNLPYVYKNLSTLSEEKREAWREFIKNELGMSTVPVVIKVIGGFEELKEEVKND